MILLKEQPDQEEDFWGWFLTWLFIGDPPTPKQPDTEEQDWDYDYGQGSI